MYFNNTMGDSSNDYSRATGMSVRLVRDAN